MILETVEVGGCRSYVIGCPKTLVGAVIDPEISAIERYRGLAAKHGLTLRYAIDTHTHADHFSAAREIGKALNAQIVMSHLSPAPFVDLRLDDGDMLLVGDLRIQAMATPGHTADSTSLILENADGKHAFTGDALLIGGTGRTDLPTGDPDKLYDSLFGRLLKLDPATQIHPAHEYKGRPGSTIGAEIKTNPRLQKTERADFVTMMRTLDLKAPTHLTEALRVNMSGAKSVARLLSEASSGVPFMSMAELSRRLAARQNDLVVLDVREKDAFDAGHLPGAMFLPRGQLELRVNEAFPDPTVRIVTVCEFGKISTLAAHTLRSLGFMHAAALDGGMKAWREAGMAVEK
ncbi:MAG TPA: rhodanese-like domain-containing protein [Hyphomonadaceae bacterium]|nr:rhodanese-like domain-containing protein [Hyphomonadaceae bacterium]